MSTDTDPSWKYYPQTILGFPDHELRIDLRVPLATSSRNQLLELCGGHEMLHVLTADNPYGQAYTKDSNEALHEELKMSLANLRLPHYPCNGMSPDHAHVEFGFAFASSLEQARDLAAYFRQTAFFHFDGECFSLITPRDEYPPMRLPLDALKTAQDS